MKKREEADSGLMSGFVHEDKLKQAKAQQDSVENVERKKLEAELAQREAESEKHATDDAPKNETEKDGEAGPQVAVKGVSGKMITGVIKAVKRVNPKTRKPKIEPQVEEELAKVEQAEIAEKVAPKVEEPKVTEVKPAPPNQSEAKVESKASPSTTEEKTEQGKEVAKAVAKTTEVPAEEIKAPVVEPQQAEPKTSEKETVKKSESKPASEKKEEVAPVKAESKAKEMPAPKTEAPVQPATKPEKVTSKKTEKVEVAKESGPKPEAKTTVKDDAPKRVVKRDNSRLNRTQYKDASSADPKRKVKRDEPRVKSDRGVILSAQERLARAGKTIIRPQSGNYVGRDSSSTPAFKERSGRRDDRRDNKNRFDKRNNKKDFRDNRAPQRGRNDFMDKDKDEGETPIRSKPRRKKRVIAMPDPSLINNQKDQSRRNYKQKSQRRDQRGSGWRSREELEFDEETVRRARRRRARTESQKTSDKPQIQKVELPSSMTVKDLAEMLKKTSADVITKLISFGVMATVNQEIDYDTGAIIASEFGIKPSQKIEVSEEDILFDDSEDDEKDLKPRPPVVVVMGHVDHGKTSVLDWIRNSRVAAGEAGGITQHIGAYMVNVKGKPITFLDTPGHEAFTAIRARGAQVTDLAVLVVAADDGVMPQTIEAINHAKAAGTEVIVAINKIDKASANIDRVKQELAAHEILDSDWGGTTTMVPVSAKTGENMEELLEMIVLTAEVMELKANPDRQAKGTVIEASLDKNRGPIATLLVQRGTLEQGDSVVVGTMMGNVRAMFNDRNQAVQKAGPSVPVEIMGLPEVPEAGDIFYEVEDERLAKSLVERRQAEEREKELSRTNKLSLENLFEQMNKGETKDLNIVLKADVQGSISALATSLEKLSNDEVSVHIIHSGVGAITASDVRLADVSNAIIIGFNVRPAGQVKELAQEANVEIRMYSVIYEAIEEVEKALVGMLDPVFVEEVLGHATVREIYKVSGVGTVAGCYVNDGLIRRSAQVRVVRGGIVLHEGRLASLKRFKDDAREVQEGYECGLSVDRYNDIEVDDVIEAFHMKEIKPSLGNK